MHEDPLCAIPNKFRKQFQEEYGISISGSLSPYMQLVLNEKYEGNFLKLPVKRLYLSEMSRKELEPLFLLIKRVKIYQSL